MAKPANLVLIAATLVACSTPQQQSGEARVWSSSSSADGFAGCPSGTTVVGGGYEIAEAYQVPGKIPVVVGSKPYGNGWRVMCSDERGAPSPGCKAWVVCASVLK
jgi:hypothetical protein